MPNAFYCATPDIEASQIILLGVPFDATSSFRPGSRFAPDFIRLYSEIIESYSPYQEKDLATVKFYDAGNVDVTISNFSTLRVAVQQRVGEYLRAQKKVIALGGEHLISLPVVEAYAQTYPDLHVIHVDAHADLRDEYLGEPYSHATVMRRICDLVGGERIYQFGIRSGTQAEFAFARTTTHFHPFEVNSHIMEALVETLRDVPIYLTIDLDVLDPSCFPGTGTPEAGGLTFEHLLHAILSLKPLNIVGADLVELCPAYDSGEVSTMTVIKLLRELILMLSSPGLEDV